MYLSPSLEKSSGGTFDNCTGWTVCMRPFPMSHPPILTPPPTALPGARVRADRSLVDGPSTPAAATVRRPSQRESVLDAAEAVVLADGAAHLTLDAVAERAGLSKGGLLYHFPTKELLLQAMVDRHMHRIDQSLARASSVCRPGRAAS